MNSRVPNNITDEAALRAAVQQNPHDWTPRLVLADYLDDHGTEPHHAEEAARIRQAADPSTPLGRAVAASRRAWASSAKPAARTLSAGQDARAATLGERTIDTILHHPDRTTRLRAAHALVETHTRRVVRHNRAADSTPPVRGLHRDAADAHGEAGMWVHQYARTL